MSTVAGVQMDWVTDVAKTPSEVLRELADVIGQDAALRLGQAMGGARWYIPASLPAEHPLVLLLGNECVQRLCAVYQGDVLELPSKAVFRAERDRVLRYEYFSMRVKGSRADTLAVKYGLSRRRVLGIVG